MKMRGLCNIHGYFQWRSSSSCHILYAHIRVAHVSRVNVLCRYPTFHHTSMCRSCCDCRCQRFNLNLKFRTRVEGICISALFARMKNCIFKRIKKETLFFAGDPQNEVFLIATQSAYNTREHDMHKKNNNRENGCEAHFQWRPLTLLPSLDSTTSERRIFFFQHTSKWNHKQAAPDLHNRCRRSAK